MKVAFINPNLGNLAGLNIGLAYVISAVEKTHAVKLLDLSFHSANYQPYLQEAISGGKPEIIAFSVTSFTVEEGLRIAKFIREHYPRIPFIFGGVHPTLLPEEMIKHPLVDAICIGEGERSFPEYLDKLQEAREPQVEGIWYKDKNGQVHKNGLRPFAEDIDGLAPPNWDHWGIEKYLDTNLYYLPGALKCLSSRGCPYNCSFCSNKAIQEAAPGRYYRVRSPQKVIDEIKMNREKYGKKGLQSIAFGDDIFGLDIAWLKNFCSLYKNGNLAKELKWMCATRADVVTQEWAGTAAASGCKMVMLGVESGDDYIRMQVYKKNITRKDILGATAALRDSGIAFGFYMLVGCPRDTRSTIKSSLRLVSELDPAVSHFSFYQPLPKTELLHQVQDALWVEKKGLGGYWNKPRISTLSLSAADLGKIMRGIRVKEFARFLKLGLRLKGAVFIIDLAKYLFAAGTWKNLLLMKFHLKSDLQQKTIFKYILENEK